MYLGPTIPISDELKALGVKAFLEGRKTGNCSQLSDAELVQLQYIVSALIEKELERFAKAMKNVMR